MLWAIASTFSLALLQSNEQVLQKYKQAQEQFTKSAYAEAIRLCDEAAKDRPDKEGTLRVRVGAGYDDKEFEPRRLAGDAAAELAKVKTDLKEKKSQLEAAVKWYSDSAKLGLAKAGALLDKAKKDLKDVDEAIRRAAAAEGFRKLLEATRAAVAKKSGEREFEAAYAELDRVKADFAGNEAAWEQLKRDVDADLARWRDGLLADLAQDLDTMKASALAEEPRKLAERFARYRVPPEQAKAERLDPALGWAARLASIAEKAPLDLAALEQAALSGLGMGVPHWRLAEGLVLETLAAGVKDPGPAKGVDERWAAVEKGSRPFGDAAGRAKDAVERALKEATGARKTALERWLAEDLAAVQRRVAAVRAALPDRDAPRAVEACLAKLRSAEVGAGAKPDGYDAVDAELERIAKGSKLDDGMRAKLLAARAVAKAHALFLGGRAREAVVAAVRDLVAEAVTLDPKAFEAWKDVSPKVAGVIEESRK